MAQDVTQRFEVPADGYESTDTYLAGDLWNEYIVHVVRDNELIYNFQVVGEGEIMVSLIPGTHPNIYSSQYTSFSTSQPVTEYSVTFPAVIGFDRDYSIVVNSSGLEDVQYTVNIHTELVEKPDYTIYYILLILGFVAIVIFSYKYVVWQEKKEKEEKKAAREKQRGKRHKK